MNGAVTTRALEIEPQVTASTNEAEVIHVLVRDFYSTLCCPNPVKFGKDKVPVSLDKEIKCRLKGI